jgi:hypothetical protein
VYVCVLWTGMQSKETKAGRSNSSVALFNGFPWLDILLNWFFTL